MATIKSYTDLEQSKKLAEILPIESADMYYTANLDCKGKIIGLLDVPLYIGSDGFVDTEMGEIYAWSLAALLNVLPDCIVMNKDFQTGKYHFCSILAETFVTADNPIDACYGFIVKYMN